MTESAETGAELQFDRADYTKSSEAGVPCTACKGPLGGAYWKWQQHVVCARCRDGLEGALASSRSNTRLLKAILLGGGTALGLGIAYAGFVAATKMQFALATIGMAFVIARVVKKASGGFGGTRFQIVAVAFTYLAATMGYIPGLWQGLKAASDRHADDRAQASAQADSSGGAEATASPDEPRPRRSMNLLVGVAWLIGIMLAAPFLEFTEAPFGLLIVVFGLWEAWKLSRGPPARIEGPFRVGPAVAPLV